MKKMAFFLLIVFGSFKTAFSQIYNIVDNNATVLWGIVNNSGDTSYLFGTFHEFGNSYYDSYPIIRQMSNRANVIVSENIPVHRSTQQTENIINWGKDLSREDRKLLKNLVKEVGLDIKLKQLVKVPASWVEYMILSELLKQQCNTQNEQDVIGIDEYIINGGITNKKKLIGLESPNDTFNVINRMMGAKDNKDTTGLSGLIDLANHKDQYLETIKKECWEADNYRNLTINYKFNQSSFSDNSEYLYFLDERNAAWMAQIKIITSNNRAFIAVGLKHLFYKTGLLMELKRQGYVVFPIPMEKRDFKYKK